MDIKILSRRFTALLLCFVLVAVSVVPEVGATGAEEAATITVAGGALSAGGLTGSAAVTALAPYVVPVVAIALAGFGINAYVTEASKQAGMTRSQFVKNTIDDFCSVSSYGAAKFYSLIAKGITVGPTGKIQLSHEASNAISQMIEWMFTQDGMVVDTPAVGDGTVSSGTVGNYNAFEVTNSTTKLFSQVDPSNSYQTYDFYVTVSGASAPVYACCCFYTSQGSSSVHFYMSLVSSASFTATSTSILGTGSSSTSSFYVDSLNSFYRTDKSFFTSFNSAGVSHSIAVPYEQTYVNVNDFQNAFAQYGFQTDAVPVPGQDCFTGTDTDYVENKDLLKPGDGQATTLDPDVLSSLADSLAIGSTWTMDITDYLDAITKAFDQAMEDVKTGIANLTDAVTGIKEQIAIPDTATADPSISTTTAEDYPSLINPDEIDVDGVAGGLEFDLTNIFPFCIPFDIYRICQLFNAEPVAPSYHVHYTAPYNIVFDFTLDFSSFNQVAAICRQMELLLFCIGLAFITRSMIIRG